MQQYQFMDIMDDFIFGPMNLAAYLIAWFAALIKKRPICRKRIKRFDKGGNYSGLEAMRILSQNGIRFIGGRCGVTHNSRVFFVVISRRQSKMFDHLYNFESDTITEFRRQWASRKPVKA